MNCPRCGCNIIYFEGNKTTHEIYCSKCLYHFDAQERSEYRKGFNSRNWFDMVTYPVNYWLLPAKFITDTNGNYLPDEIEMIRLENQRLNEYRYKTRIGA